jgi:polyphosphate kinase
VPRALPRLLRLPAQEGAIEFTFLHDIVYPYSNRLFHGYEILSVAPFRVTRSSNLKLARGTYGLGCPPKFFFCLGSNDN